MVKILAVIGFSLLVSMPIMAQSLSWAQIYSNANDDAAHSIAVGTDGYAYVTGTSTNGTTLTALIVKLDVYGNISWESPFSNGHSSDDSYGVAEATYNNAVYVVDTSSNGTNTDIRTLLINNSNGSVTASQVYDSGNNDSAFGLAVASDASFVYVVGSSFNGTNDDWRIVKYDGALTALQWGSITYDGGATDVARSCALDTYGNLYVTGYSTNAGMRTIRYNSSGAIVWNVVAGIPGDQAFGAATDAYGNVIIAGTSIGGAGTQFEVIKYNGANGTVLWDVTYNDGGIDFARGIATDFGGNAYVVGSSTTAGNTIVRIVGFRAADGSKFMTEQYSNGSQDDGWGIKVDSNLNFYVAGSSGSSPKREYLMLGFSNQSTEKGHTLLDKLLRKCGALGLDGLIFIGSLYWLKKRLRKV